VPYDIFGSTVSTDNLIKMKTIISCFLILCLFKLSHQQVNVTVATAEPVTAQTFAPIELSTPPGERQPQLRPEWPANPSCNSREPSGDAPKWQADLKTAPLADDHLNHIRQHMAPLGLTVMSISGQIKFKDPIIGFFLQAIETETNNTIEDGIFVPDNTTLTPMKCSNVDDRWNTLTNSPTFTATNYINVVFNYTGAVKKQLGSRKVSLRLTVLNNNADLTLAWKDIIITPNSSTAVTSMITLIAACLIAAFSSRGL